MRGLGESLIPHEWDISPSQGYPALNSPVAIRHLYAFGTVSVKSHAEAGHRVGGTMRPLPLQITSF